MEKKLLLAVALSAVILLGYNFLVAKVYHLEKPLPVSGPVSQTQAKETPIAEVKKAVKAAEPITLQRKELETENFKITFTNLGANIEQIYAKKFKRKFFESKVFNLEEFSGLAFKLVPSPKNEIVFEYGDAQQRIRKTFSISNNTIELDLEISNLATSPQNVSLNLNLFSFDLLQEDAEFKKDKNYFELDISLSDKILRKNLLRVGPKDVIHYAGEINWIGLKDRYFTTMFKTGTTFAGYYLQLVDKKILTVGIPVNYLSLEPKSSFKFKTQLYAGPLEKGLLDEIDKGFAQIINFGVFDPISKGLLSLLRAIHKIVPSWGFCIILLSCALFFLLYPLTAKSLRQMKAMQMLQPQIEKIRQQYKNDPQKLNKEIMELYRKNRLNPLGGCLPMILQIPIFIALYQALLRSLELRGSNFLWIKDLSEPDRLFSLPYNIPILGNEFNILPILMAIIMFLQQKLSSKGGAGVNPEQQKFMLIFFPILFGIMFYHVPSGLVLYWFVYSGLSLIFQLKQNVIMEK